MNAPRRYDDDYDLLIPGSTFSMVRNAVRSGDYRSSLLPQVVPSRLPQRWDCEWCGGLNRRDQAECHVCGAMKGTGQKKLVG